jgi:hypothetical protein
MPNPALRSAVLRLLLSIVVLHAAAIAAYYVAGIGRRPVAVQYAFLGVWLILTLIVVLGGLQRVRVARIRRLQS